MVRNDLLRTENDIITRGVTVKIQQVTVRGNYENPSSDANGENE